MNIEPKLTFQMFLDAGFAILARLRVMDPLGSVPDAQLVSLKPLKGPTILAWTRKDLAQCIVSLILRSS